MSRVSEAIRMYWGERCGTYDPECPVCLAWAEFDARQATRKEVDKARARVWRAINRCERAAVNRSWAGAAATEDRPAIMAERKAAREALHVALEEFQRECSNERA